VTSTLINETQDVSKNLNHFSGVYIVSTKNTLRGFSNSSHDNIIPISNPDPITNYTKFLGDGIKVLFSLGIGPYNFFAIGLPSILRLRDRYPDALFVVDYAQAAGDKTFAPFAEKFLEYLKINFVMLNSSEEDIVANNFIPVGYGEVPVTHRYMKDASEAYLATAGIERGLAEKKAYLSRRSIKPRPYDNIKPGLSTNIDYRMYNEEALEQFFFELGYDIVVPELFASMEDQIKYFSEVSVLVSTTSSGLANMIFMPEGSTVIELATTFPMMHTIDQNSDGVESLHHIYAGLSYMTNKNYIAIPNYTRQADDVTGIIKSSKLLQKIF
jgi:hypothetical protein